MEEVLLDGLPLGPLAGLEVSQTYERIGGASLYRGRSGRGRKQTHWQKLKTTLSAQGWMPAALAAVDESVPHVLDCLQPRSLIGIGRQFALPVCRPDVEPVGYAVVAEQLVQTGVAVAGNTATLAAVDGAAHYQVLYWPRLTGFVTVSENGSPGQANFGWELVLEEQ